MPFTLKKDFVSLHEIQKSEYDKKINKNSIGSVIPVKNAVNASDATNPIVAFLFSFLAHTTIAKAIAIIPNIITGKNPA